MSDSEAMYQLESVRKRLKEELREKMGRGLKFAAEELIDQIQALDIALGCLLRRKDKGV